MAPLQGDGDERARERLVVAYSPLVKYVAGRMASGLPAHVEEADLISYGLVGLISAIERFDLEREIKFETYAITAHQGRDHRRAALAGLGAALGARPRAGDRAGQRQARAPAPARAHRRGDGGRAGDHDRGVPGVAARRSRTRRSPRSTSCGRSSDSSGDQVSLLDTLQDPDAPDPAKVMDATELKDRIADAIARLPEREKLVIALYYYENLTLREIGEVLGVTESRVSQLHTKAVLRLRSRLRSAGVSVAAAALRRRRHGIRPRCAAPDHEERRPACTKPPIGSATWPSSAIAASGKTSLHEALLFQAGAMNRLGSVVDGTTVSDADADEKARQMSISAALASFEWQDRKVNLIDTPGEPSFVADALGALRVCESAVFVVNAVMGVEVSTTRLWQRAAELDLARLIFVNMLDRERADFFRTLDSLKSAFGPHVVATEIPIGSEHEVRGVIDLVDMKAYEYDGDGRDNCREIPIPDELADAGRRSTARSSWTRSRRTPTR